MDVLGRAKLLTLEELQEGLQQQIERIRRRSVAHCLKHPKYKVIRMPRVCCDACWCLWVLKIWRERDYPTNLVADEDDE